MHLTGQLASADLSDAVLVVGGGLAGVVAALELLEAGRRVLLLDRDREENFGGLAKESFGGILLVDTPEQRWHRIRDSAALALEDWGRFGGLTPTDGWPWRWAEAYVSECRTEVYEWLRRCGLRFLPMPHWVERNGNSVPRWHIVWGSGYRLATALVRRLSSHPRARSSLEMRFEHRVERLLTSQGRVIGCAGVHERTGEPFEVHAAGVLIAAGGLNGDLMRVRRCWPLECGPAPSELLNGSHRYADGRLHDAVAALGGRLTHLNRMWNYAAGVRHWSPRKPEHGVSLVPPRGAVWLDAQGARFMPPLLAGLDTSELVARIAQAGGTSWQVMNRQIAMRELAAAGAEFNVSLRERRPLRFIRDMLFGNRAFARTLLSQCPDVATADTLPDLVAKMNALRGDERVRLENVERGVREYDAAILHGAEADPQVRNILEARRWKGDRLRTVKPTPILAQGAGPLIAIHERIISRKSLGGIATDLDGRVLALGEQIIEGLYAAGEASGFGGGGANGRRALE
ncbi:MAG TPA: FAD-dependent oxidoreductase, partial [Steroidobacter sp.]|nr:FAD-dependent oxidoreductase [Steroidobacter sp.]